MTETTHREIVSEGIFDDMHQALDGLCSCFVSPRPNAMYKEGAFVNVMAATAASNGYIGPVLDNLRGSDKVVDIEVDHWKEVIDEWQKQSPQIIDCPTSHWALGRLRMHSKEFLLEKGTEFLNASIAHASKVGALPKSGTFSLDAHDKPCHGKMNDDTMRRSKPKGGTSKMESYLTMSTVGGQAITTSIMPYTKGDSVVDLAATMINNTKKLGINIDKLLMDRGFYSMDMFTLLHESKIPYIMAVPKTKPIKKYVEAFHNGTGDAIVQHTLKCGKKSVEVRLLIHKREDADEQENVTDKYIVLAVGVEYETVEEIIASIPEEYRKRWGIETGYRIIESMRARTRSMTPGVRWFFFIFSAVLVNFWVLSNWIVLNKKTKVTAPEDQKEKITNDDEIISHTGTKVTAPAITTEIFKNCIYEKVRSIMIIRCIPYIVVKILLAAISTMTPAIQREIKKYVGIGPP